MYETHLFKDPGEIPTHLARLGYETITVIHEKAFVSKGAWQRTYEIGFIKPGEGAPNPLRTVQYFIRTNVILFKILKTEKPDIIVVQYLPLAQMPALAFYKALRRLIEGVKVKVIAKLDTDGSFAQGPLNLTKLYHSLLSVFIDKATVETPCAYERIVKSLALRVLAKKLKVMPNGVPDDVAALEPRASRERSILFAGQLIYRKGLDVLIRALVRLKASGVLRGWKVIIVGPYADPVYSDLMRKYVKLSGLEDLIELRGDVPREELLRLYSSSCVFVLPTRGEGSPLVLTEAPAMGLRVITTEAVCKKFFEKLGARIVKVDDVEGLARSIAVSIELCEKYGPDLTASMATRLGLAWNNLVKKLMEP